QRDSFYQLTTLQLEEYLEIYLWDNDHVPLQARRTFVVLRIHGQHVKSV
ncbi:unnamed protein product, partial [Allacma fusca]